MIDFKTTLVDSLNTATNLPVYYELFANSSSTLPCITYRESNNYDVAIGDTLGYSRVSYTIKLWGKTTDMSNLMSKAQIIDATMRELGFTKTSYNELTLDNDLELIFLYTGMAQEDYVQPL